MAHEGEDHGEEEYCEAEGIGCPLPGDHDQRYVRVLGEEDGHEHMDYHITLSSDRPRGVRLGKVVGFRVRMCVCVSVLHPLGLRPPLFAQAERRTRNAGVT